MSDIFKNSITVIIAVIGWIVVHRFTSKRGLENKRREIRIKFLMDTYVKLCESLERNSEENKVIFENAISEIQFIGNNQQIKIAKGIAKQLQDNGVTDIQPLITNLRDSLR